MWVTTQSEIRRFQQHASGSSPTLTEVVSVRPASLSPVQKIAILGLITIVAIPVAANMTALTDTVAILQTQVAELTIARQQLASVTTEGGIPPEAGESGSVAGESLDGSATRLGERLTSDVPPDPAESRYAPRSPIPTNATPQVLGVSNHEIIAAFRATLAEGLPADILVQLKGEKGDKGDPGLTVGYTLPTSTNTSSIGTIAGFTHLGSSDLSAGKLTVTETLTVAATVPSTFEGNLTVKGNTTLGDATSDITSISGNAGIGTASPNILASNANSRVLTIVGDGTLTNANGRIELANPRANASLAAGDEAGRIMWVMSNNSGGVNGQHLGQLLMALDGSGGVNGFGSRMSFYTKPDNTATIIERMRIDQAGNVGIGTSSPATKLHVYGSGVGRQEVRIESADTNQPWLSFYNNGNERGGIYSQNDTLGLIVRHGTTARVGIGSGLVVGNGYVGAQSGPLNGAIIEGNVGIGTTNPAANLDIVGSSRITAAANSGGLSTRVTGDSFNRINIQSDRMLFGEGSAAADLTLQSVDNDDIHALVLSRNVANAMPAIRIENLDGTPNNGRAISGFYLRTYDDGVNQVKASMHSYGSNYTLAAAQRKVLFSSDRGAGVVLRAQDAGATIEFWTLGTTERMRIDSSGNVGIGTTAPLTRLDLAGNLRTTGKATAVLTGSIDPGASTTVTGVGTLFTTELVVGDRITVTGETRTVTAIASNTSLTVDTAFSDNANDTSPDALYASATMRDSANVLKLTVNDLGNVGIGTTNPASILDVEDTSTNAVRGIISGQHSDFGTSPVFAWRKSRGTAASPTVITTGDGLGTLRAYGYDGSNYLLSGEIGVFSSGTIAATRVPTYMEFSTATDATPSVLTERMRIDSSGNVGIGTTGPGQKLHVEGTGETVIRVNSTSTTGNGAISVENDTAKSLFLSSRGSADAGTRYGLSMANMQWVEAQNSSAFVVGTQSTAPLVFGTNLNERMRIDGSTGNVGIGTTSPGERLTVSPVTTAGDLINTTTHLKTNTGSVDVSGATIVNVMGTSINEPTLTATSAKTITGAATLRIGGPPIAGANVTITSAAALIIDAGNVGIGTTVPSQTLHVAGGLRVTTSVAVTDDRTLCTIAASGEIEFVNGACGTSSRRYKENIKELGYGLEELKKLDPVFFNYIKDADAPSDDALVDDRTKRRIGFIAEEVQEVIPEVVIWQDGQIENVDYAHLTALAVKGIQELNAKIAELTVTQTVSGELVALNADLNANGFSLLNVRTVTSISGAWSIDENGLIVAVKVKAEFVEGAKGFTTFDQVTGDPYCIQVRNGVTLTLAGRCDELTVAGPTPQATADGGESPPAVNEPEPASSQEPAATESPPPAESTDPEPSPEPAPEPTPEPATEPTAEQTDPAA